MAEAAAPTNIERKDYYTAGEVISWLHPDQVKLKTEEMQEAAPYLRENRSQEMIYAEPSQAQVDARTQIFNVIKSNNNNQAPTSRQMFDHIIGALKKNPEFVEKLYLEVQKIVKENEERIGGVATTAYCSKKWRERNMDSSQSFGAVPMFGLPTYSGDNTFEALNQIVITLRLLREWGIITDDTKLKVRTIDLVNGTGEWIVAEDKRSERFQLNTLAQKKRFAYDSFHAVDIATTFINGTEVNLVDNMAHFSFSAHTDHIRVSKMSTPFKTDVAQNGFTTVAGSMIFNGEPEIYMFGNTRDRSYMKAAPDGSNLQPVPMITLSEQPFDILQYATNEYGQGALRFILGVKITDVGYTGGINDTVEEVVCTWEGAFFCPWYKFDLDKESIYNEIDILGLGNDERSPLVSLRAAIAGGVMDPRELYSEQWQSFFDGNDELLRNSFNDTFERPNKRQNPNG